MTSSGLEMPPDQKAFQIWSIWLLMAPVITLVRLPHEDEGRPLHDGSARANERDVDVLHLPHARASRRLQRALDDVPEAVDASRSEAPAEGVERQIAVQLDAPVLDEIERLAFLAEPIGLQAVDH